MGSQIEQALFIATLAASVFLGSSGTSMANLALPAVATEFSISFSTAKWVVLSYLMAITVFSLFIGRLGDRHGRRKILFAGTFIFCLGTLFSVFSFSFATLIFGRIIQGIGASSLVALPVALVADSLPTRKMGRAIGLLATMSAMGTAAGPSVGGFLIAEFGWRSVFVAMSGLGTLILFSMIKFIHSRESFPIQNQKDSFFGSLMPLVLESKSRLSLISNLAVSNVMVSTLIVGPFFLTRNLHLDARTMGLVMSAGPITSILFGIIAGYIVDRWGHHFISIVGLLQLLVGATAFVFLPEHLGTLGFVISAVLLSLGYQLFLSANSNGFMKNTRSDSQGAAAGALQLSRNLGLISGTYLMSGIFDLFVHGFQAVFTTAAIIIILVVLIQGLNAPGHGSEKNFLFGNLFKK